MRSAKETKEFPYNIKSVCYILIYKDKVEQVIQYRKCDI